MYFNISYYDVCCKGRRPQSHLQACLLIALMIRNMPDDVLADKTTLATCALCYTRQCWSRYLLLFMAPRTALLCSQNTVTTLYPEPHLLSSSYHHLLLTCSIILKYNMCQVSSSDHFISDYGTKTHYECCSRKDQIFVLICESFLISYVLLVVALCKFTTSAYVSQGVSRLCNHHETVVEHSWLRGRIHPDQNGSVFCSK